MTHAHSSGAPAQERAEHERLEKWMSAAAALAVGGAFFALWFWLLPGWLGFRVETAGAARWRWLAAIPSVLGFAVALRCIWDFGWTGRGTPAPFAPPQRLVVVGFYRYVRNPMYVGFAVGWIGLWVVFGHANPRVIAAGGAFMILSGKPLILRVFMHPPESEVSTLLLALLKEMGGVMLMLSAMLFLAARDPARNVAILDALIVGLCILAITPLLSLKMLDLGSLYPTYLIWGRSLVRLVLASVLFYARPRDLPHSRPS